MRLFKYKINKFRSVKGTEWIGIDDLACFVGINESGKTNLLLPLWKFNPADNATNIDLLHDYPRDEFSLLGAEHCDRQDEAFIEVVFKLSDAEQREFNDLLSHDKIDESKSPSETNDIDADTESMDKLIFSDFVLIQKDYRGRFYIFISNENAEILSEEIEGIVGKEIFDKICEFIPKFVYYSDYGNLDSDLYLPHVKDNLNRIDNLTGKERMKARTLKVLFNHLQLSPDEILKLGKERETTNQPPKTNDEIAQESRNKQERFAKLESAASRLTKQFQQWWKQGNYVFTFNADGLYFRIFVSDTERPEKIELESRSKGLQWFFSFFLVFLAESKESHQNCILLLDEPGLSLHPNAQSDLINFFQQLSEKNQLIYTTHLPFLVDHNNLDRVKAVYTQNGLTRASNDLSKADKEKKAIQPVNAAIGITASQSLLIGCQIIIVEGISDQMYLTMIKKLSYWHK
ncbi:TPA: ATP-binding protein [Legionella pneumophila]|nr:ATP-binding protein [Legionella pneumophila]HAU9905887.1 ATP-binding protein [Legionella pneumophila]HAU9927333.1 ATP-binding protein [Legionella pneumophila]HAU9930266.1 ATP-binding protein [Legionella pneumophila]HAU9933936.1 ATP-binding protein [Legionella pneumophila]